MPATPICLTLASNKIFSLKDKFKNIENVLWIYLGVDVSKSYSMDDLLGDRFEQIKVPELYTTAADDIRKEHVAWIDDLNRRYGENAEWWFWTVSSRNIYESNLFLYSCYLEILKRLVIRKEKAPQLVVVESAGLLQAIKKWADENNIAVEVPGEKSITKSVMRFYIYPSLRWAKFVFTHLLRWFFAKITKITATSALNGGTDYFLLCTHLHHNSFSDGVFKDRYFPFLYEYLKKKNIPIVVYPLTHNITHGFYSIFMKMRKAACDFIIQEDYLFASDYLCAVTYPFRVKKKLTAPPFRGFDLRAIIFEEQREKGVVSGLNAVLVYRLFLRLKESLPMVPSQILMWYENQYSDRAIILACRERFSRIKIVGAQLYILAPNYLMLYPSSSEVEAGITPDILIEPGKYQCRTVKSFTEDLLCRSAAALRYSHLYKDSTAKVLVKTDNATLLVLLPLNMEESVELLWVLKQVADKLNPDIKILLKVHPDYNVEIFKKRAGPKNWHNRFLIVEGKLSDALHGISVILSTNSSAMIEGVVRGIPVISLGRQSGLSQYLFCRIETEMVAECFYVDEVVEGINRYLAVRKKRRKEWLLEGKRIRDIFFEPVNDETLAPFI